jgi:type 1 glutamine amidotransferase
MNSTHSPLRLAVITGGHAFDVPHFHQLFRRLNGVDAYIQHLDDFVASSPQTRAGYAVVLFYIMPGRSAAEHARDYAAHNLTVLESLRESGQGLVVLHHGILSYPDWPTWRELCGIDATLNSYAHDQTLRVRVSPGAHPITAGLADFELIDETYEMNEPDPGCEPLLTTDHPQSVKTLAWTRTFGKSRVFSLALGHDDQSWSSPNFQQVLERGIYWTVS